MKINCGEIIDALNRNGEEVYSKLNDLVTCIKQIQEDWRDRNFIEVRVFNTEGNITSRLHHAFPSYEIWWEGDIGYCGENIILVPAADWNDVLKQEIAEFDSEYGHHQETQIMWKLKDDVKLPNDLKYDIENFKRDILNKTGKLPEVVQLPTYAFRQWPWQRYDSLRQKYFDEVSEVVKEYNIELTVDDRRKYAREDPGLRYKTIEI